MKQNSNISKGDDIADLMDKIRYEVKAQSGEQYIPDFIEFCESKSYLNLPSKNVHLYPMQRTTLKCFYRGQPGNENLRLTEDEIQLLYSNKLDNVLEKYNSNCLFRDLVLVLGRRCISGDTLIFDANTGESKSIQEWHKIGEKFTVWAWNEELSQFEKHLAEPIDQGERECLRVTLENSDYVDCTPNHPLLTVDGWVNTEELKPGDEIAQNNYVQTPNSQPKRPIEFTKIQTIEHIGIKNTYDLSIIHEEVNKETCCNFMIHNGLQMHNSGKDFMVSLIALYEAMRLLEMPGGSPFKYYNLAEGNPIFILTVATSSDQARILFTEIKEKMMSSDYFKDKIGFVEADRIYLLTPQDKHKNKSILDSGVENVAARTKGSVVIMSGHSNSESLLGKRIYTLLLDEVASFKSTGGSTSGDRIYSALTPATADFQRLTGELDDKGNPVKVRDSKVISISSPRSEEGKLFQLYKTAHEDPFRLAVKLPTWKVNTAFSEDSLRMEFKHMSPDEWNMEFGAEFSGTAGEKFIADHYVDEAVEIGAELNLQQRTCGVPGMIYYAHLDPAATSHNYALIVLHVEQRVRLAEREGRVIKEKTKMFVIDHIMAWEPIAGKAINVFEVDKYITDLAKVFRFAMVSYDNWNSQSSVQKLRRKGIPTKITPFRKQYKMSIYDNLHYLLVNHQLALPPKGPYAQSMIMELKCLKRIYTPVGFKIQPNLEAQKTTDDLCDCVAGACAIAVENIYTGYPQSTTVNMPHSPTLGSNQSWQIGQGVYNDSQWRFMNKKFGY